MTSQNIITENIKAGEYQAYLAYPAEGAMLPGVIIIHEIFGLNDNIRSIARRFAEAGYVGLAVDLYSKSNPRPFCVFTTAMGVFTNALKTGHMHGLDEVMRYLQGLSQVDPNQIGAIGFCMGGGYALAFAIHNQELKASSIFYAANPKPLNVVARACPIVGSYPDKDFTTKLGQKLDETLTMYQRPHNIKIYPNTLHSFFNDQSKSYNPDAAEDAWKRTMEFFQEYLPAETAVKE